MKFCYIRYKNIFLVIFMWIIINDILVKFMIHKHNIILKELKIEFILIRLNFR